MYCHHLPLLLMGYYQNTHWTEGKKYMYYFRIIFNWKYFERNALTMKFLIWLFLNETEFLQIWTSGLLDYLLYLIYTEYMYDKFFLIVFVTHGQTRQGYRGIFQSALTPTTKGNFQSRLHCFLKCCKWYHIVM